MKYSQAEKFEIIRMVEQSDLGVRRTLKQIGGEVRAVSTGGIVGIKKMDTMVFAPDPDSLDSSGTVYRMRNARESSIAPGTTQ